jgi:hypothetical protein
MKTSKVVEFNQDELSQIIGHHVIDGRINDIVEADQIKISFSWIEGKPNETRAIVTTEKVESTAEKSETQSTS